MKCVVLYYPLPWPPFVAAGLSGFARHGRRKHVRLADFFSGFSRGREDNVYGGMDTGYEKLIVARV